MSEVNLSIPLRCLGWSYTSPSYFRRSWIVSLGNVKNSFWVFAQATSKTMWWFLMGSLDQALLLLSVCAVVSAQWWKNRVPPSSEQKQLTGVPAACCTAAGDLLIESPICETQTELPAARWAIPVGPVVWLSSLLINLLPSLGAGLSRCSVWGHGCPGCYGNWARLGCRSKSSPSPLITYTEPFSCSGLQTELKPCGVMTVDLNQAGRAGAQCSSPPAFKGHAGENYSQWFFSDTVSLESTHLRLCALNEPSFF